MKCTAVIAATLMGLASAQFPVRRAAITDTFDRVPAPVGFTPPGNPVDGAERGALSYRSWSYDRFAGANTSPNVIITGPASQFRDGGVPSFVPKNDSVISFDERSIFYGCTTPPEIPSPPAQLTGCTIRVTGRMANGFNVTQDFVYDPRSLPRGQRLAFGPFEPDFVNLVELDTELIATDNNNPGVSPVFDSNSYVATIRNN